MTFVQCPHCDGKGWLATSTAGGKATCEFCGGKGQVGVAASAELVGVSVEKLDPVAGDLIVVRYTPGHSVDTIQKMAEGLSVLAQQLGVVFLVLPDGVKTEHLSYTDPDVLEAVGQDLAASDPLMEADRKQCVDRVVKFLRSLWDTPEQMRFNPPTGLNVGAVVELTEDHCFFFPTKPIHDAVMHGGTVGTIVGDHNAPHSYRVAFPWGGDCGGEVLVEVAAGQLRRIE